MTTSSLRGSTEAKQEEEQWTPIHYLFILELKKKKVGGEGEIEFEGRRRNFPNKV